MISLFLLIFGVLPSITSSMNSSTNPVAKPHELDIIAAIFTSIAAFMTCITIVFITTRYPPISSNEMIDDVDKYMMINY